MKEAIKVKQQQVSEIAEKIQKSTAVIAFRYQGLTVDKFMQLRRNLRANGCEVSVIKNNISRRAAQESGYESFTDALSGPVALVFSASDSVAPAKELFKFDSDKVEVLKGIVDGDVFSFDDLKKLSELPPYEVLLTQLAAGMLGTLRNLAVGLNMLVEKEA